MGPDTPAITIVVWFLLATLIGWNLIAAGVSAMLHVWKPAMSRGSRILLSALVAGALPGTMMLVVPFADPALDEVWPFLLGFVFATLFGAACSLPLAIIVTRRLMDMSGLEERFR